MSSSSPESTRRLIPGLFRRTASSSEPSGQPSPWTAFSRGESALSLIDRLEEKLSQSLSDVSESHWKWMVDSYPDGLCLTTVSGQITHANPAFTALLSPVDKELDSTIDELLVEKTHSGAEEIGNRIARGMDVFSVELYRGEQPEDGILRLSCSPLRDEQQHVAGLVWGLRDVTQQKLAEEMRNQFVFTATHELRTPLGNLNAYAEMLATEDDIPPEKQRDFCNVIRGEASRLARLVDELLNISQMEGGGLSVQQRDIDLQRMLEEANDAVESEIERKRQHFEYVPPAKYPKLQGDREKLFSALVNLLGNASKYTPEEGEIRFEVELDETQIQFHVDDTGFGISPEEAKHIFDKFFRSQDERVRAETGNGLGLAYSHEVVRLHGGTLTVQSELNRGSRFTMTLPLA